MIKRYIYICIYIYCSLQIVFGNEICVLTCVHAHCRLSCKVSKQADGAFFSLCVHMRVYKLGLFPSFPISLGGGDWRKGRLDSPGLASALCPESGVSPAAPLPQTTCLHFGICISCLPFLLFSYPF